MIVCLCVYTHTYMYIMIYNDYIIVTALLN